MADESDLDKTEAATPRRREKAREEGQVARSRELASFALLAAGFYGAWLFAGPSGAHLQAMLRGAFTFARATAFATDRMLSRGITRSSRRTESTFSARVRWISRRSG